MLSVSFRLIYKKYIKRQIKISQYFFLWLVDIGSEIYLFTIFVISFVDVETGTQRLSQSQ